MIISMHVITDGFGCFIEVVHLIQLRSNLSKKFLISIGFVKIG